MIPTIGFDMFSFVHSEARGDDGTIVLLLLLYIPHSSVCMVPLVAGCLFLCSWGVETTVYRDDYDDVDDDDEKSSVAVVCVTGEMGFCEKNSDG